MILKMNNPFDFIDDNFKFISFILIVITFVIIAISVGSYLVDKNIYCPHLGENLELETKYDFWSDGCYVKMENGRWIDADEYKGITIDN